MELIAAKTMYRGSTAGIGHITHFTGAVAGAGYYYLTHSKKFLTFASFIKSKFKERESKQQRSNFSAADYFDVGLMLIAPWAIAYYSNVPSHSKITIVASYFWNPKMTVILALFIAYDSVKRRRDALGMGELSD
jgi:hypothetical protein